MCLDNDRPEMNAVESVPLQIFLDPLAVIGAKFNDDVSAIGG